jgi:glycosyltransferase involved in cell wall biosynthesis
MVVSTENRPDLPLLTIIVAVYNGAVTLQRCLLSIAAQNYGNKELIIVDGGSTDGTVDIIKANPSLAAYWISEPDRGIYNAWNKALAHAHGEWICFLGADDVFRSENALSDMAPHLARAYPPVRIVYGQVAIVNTDDDELYRIGQRWEDVRKRFFSVMCLPHPGLMHHRSLFADLGCFDESFRISGDYELLLRELKQANALFIPDIVTIAMRQGGASSNPSNALLSLREVRRAQKMHGRYLPGLPWLTAMARVYVRLLLWNLVGERLTRKLLDLGRRIKGLPPYWTRT